MANRTIDLSDALYDYLLAHSLNEPAVMRRLREETATLPLSIMQIAPEQGQFMALLVRLLGAKRCIEVGTFTGYSALAVALALPPEGRIVACDVNAETAAVAKRYWQEAGVDKKIDLRLAPAVETLEALLANGEAGTYDFAFIDADKSNYDSYYELSLQLLRPGGLIAIDNVLWGGDVLDLDRTDSDTLAIRAINTKVSGDSRVHCSLIPIGDGLMLARKQSA
ncbi:class I SAM-dependent methyltransferase [Pelagibius sp.]|uniref:class I SAM-dependent methyltransferase n=1 Tax=Pelagibius sp. TaxID=1931238 RepID=UPI00260C8AEB|nr:class I SAM-dependent methyltransferase [Pelagibius sp.]